MIPLAVIVAIVGAFSFFLEGVKQDALLAASHYPDILLQQQVGGRTESLFFDRYQEILETTDGIQKFFPRSWGYINHADLGKTFVIMGLDPEFIRTGLFVDAAIEQGRSITGQDTHQGVVGKALAAAFGCRVGDVIEVASPGLRNPVPIQVVGIFASTVQIYSADLLLVSRPTANEILGFLTEDECSDIMIYLNNTSMGEVVARTLTAKMGGAFPLTKAAMISLTEQSFGQKSGFFYLLWFILLVNVMIIAWSMVGHISFRLRKEIGILKAIGWDTGDILVLKTFETATMGLIAVLAGLSMGIGYMLMGAPGLKGVILGWADIYPDFPVPLHVKGSTVFLIAVLGMAPLLAGTLVPVWRIGAIDPDQAIRG